ncbi:hypothetical protein K2X92_04900 [Candidatus Gracilibacteria bacterium]|nr:hypothetical protein [Candidatus Gracilibacteria bacterium]
MNKSNSIEDNIANIFETFNNERNLFNELYDGMWESKIIDFTEHNDLSQSIFRSFSFLSNISADNVSLQFLDAIKKLNQGILVLSEPGYEHPELISYLQLIFHTFLVTVGEIDREDFTNPYGFRVSALMGLSD